MARLVSSRVALACLLGGVACGPDQHYFPGDEPEARDEDDEGGDGTGGGDGDGDGGSGGGSDGGSGEDYFSDPCGVTFTHRPYGDPASVSVAGDFNGWDADAHPMSDNGDGSWSVTVPGDEIAAGPTAYKFVEDDAWTCDPSAGLIQCDAGYRDPGDTSWTHECGLDNGSCNSMLVVPDLDQPRLVLTSLDLDAAAGELSVEASFRAGCAGDAAGEGAGDIRATLDGEDITDEAWTGSGFALSRSDLSRGRHTLRLEVTDAAGRSAEPLHVPVWVEEEDGWATGLMYYAFVDRLADGDAGLNTSEGASYELASYMGGDFQGVIDSLDYLEDMGVTVIWISNPQDNAEGAFDGDCGSYSGYHGYWPDAAYETEEHFGSAETLKALVEAAHDREMRVVMDWVANHVHEDHPYVAEHPDWFGEHIPCKTVDEWGNADYSGFDEYPETCWFAGYLPDYDFYQPEPLAAVVEEAIWWAREFDLDGFRVDGAKHVPHSLIWNLTTRLDQELEHGHALAEGSDRIEFYTVGETFTTSHDWIGAYVNEDELDAQFDFPLFFTLRAAFVDQSASLPDLQGALEHSGSLYGDAVMSTFLGNHDVSRFTSHIQAGSWADSEESACEIGDVVTDEWANDSLLLAWTWLLTSPGLPLVYYGDEIGMPGYRDPDNRHPLWWYSSAINGGTGGAFDLLDYSDGMYHDVMRDPLWHVAALGQARKVHPALSIGSSTNWWSEDDLLATARVHGEDEALVIINRSWDDRTLENGLSFAGLSTEGTLTDVLTGESFTASGDALSVWVPARSSRVLVRE